MLHLAAAAGGFGGGQGAEETIPVGSIFDVELVEVGALKMAALLPVGSGKQREVQESAGEGCMPNHFGGSAALRRRPTSEAGR